MYSARRASAINRAHVRGRKDLAVKIFNATLGVMLALLGAVASDAAIAGRGHSGSSGRSGHYGHSAGVAHSSHPAYPAHRGAFLAAPVLVAPWFFPPLGYYSEPPLPATPPVYVEQGAAPAAPAEQTYYWYYCADSQTYYPYVSECPGGWQQVVPETPPPS